MGRKFQLNIWTGNRGILVMPEKDSAAVASFRSWLRINLSARTYEQMDYYRYFLKKEIDESNMLKLEKDFDVDYKNEWQRKKQK